MRFTILVQLRNGPLRTNCSVDEVRRFAGIDAVAGLAVVSREDADRYYEASRELLARADSAEDRCVLFVRPRQPPIAFARNDQPIESFACSGPLCAALAMFESPRQLTSVFDLVQYVMSAPRLVRLRVCQTAAEILDAATSLERSSAVPVEWVMPHLGSIAHLRAALGSMAIANEGLGGAISVGLDGERIDDEAQVCARTARCRAFRTEPPGSGPYRIRQAIIERSHADVAILQDSDDFACEDRGVTLAAALAGSDVGMAGSHALNVDERTRRIFPTRYPLDVTTAYQRGGEDPLLPGAGAMRRDAFAAAGGFSTIATHSMDSQFVLRSQFFFRSINVDRFLYLRRLRAGSLTSAAATGYGSLARLRWKRRWERDFEQVRSGALALERSSLRVERPDGAAFDLIPTDGPVRRRDPHPERDREVVR